MNNFNINDAKNAVLKLAKYQGNYKAAIVERILRLEAGQTFNSTQYRRCGSGGMEKGKWAKKGLPSNITYIKLRDNATKQFRDFIVWEDVYDFCIYLSSYIDRHNGNWARWNAIDAKVQRRYRTKVKSVKNKWIVDKKLEQELDNITPFNDNSTFSKSREFWGTKVGESSIIDETTQEDYPPESVYVTKVSEVEEKDAVGIWQIVKLVADQYSLSQNINDATIATNQGSLLNYVQKVVQQPWLQFWGDTVGDQYYFQCRKEPFDYEGYRKLPIIKSVQENEVLSDELAWYEGEIFSWYQIIPRGSLLGEENFLFHYVKAVFFEEYAEIWGSKPNIQVSNYLNFNKIDEETQMFNKALKDLRYMVESNAYLPFCRQGTIVITGDNTIKRGYKLFYEPTGELFYVDAVSHSYQSTEQGPDFTTTLKVSRGVIKDQFEKYFQLINFDPPPPIDQEYEELKKDIVLLFYFDNGRSYIIDLDESFENSKSGTDIKMVNQINEFPALRNELYDLNKRNISNIADLIHRNKDQQFVCEGNMDEDNIINFPKLSQQRAVTIKSLVISEYLKKYNDMTKSELESRISTKGDINSEVPYIIDDNRGIIKVYDDEDNIVDLREKAYKRNCKFYVKPYKVKKTKKVPQSGIAWNVNREIFYYFYNRKQFITDVRR